MYQLWIVLFLSIVAVNCQSDDCDYYQMLQPASSFEIYSRGYKRGLSAGRNVHCRYSIETPPGFKISASCRFAFLFPLPKCQNTLRISRRGRVDLMDATTYCGWLGRIASTSLSNRMTMEFKTGSLPLASKFLCTFKATPDDCQCGRHNIGSKIVMGNETLINEFPLMAAIVVGNTGVQCGATIISNSAVLSAGHCFAGFSNWDLFRVVVGEHDITISTESQFTKFYNISSIIVPSEFPKEKNFDIALVFTQEPIVYNFGVSPACLPLKFFDNTFSDEKVYALGWGTIEFAGPKSDVLKKVELEILNDFICSGYEICTAAMERDTCQYDSGGPLLYKDPENKLLYNIGIIRSGSYCGTLGTGDSVRVTAHINWILKNTMSTVYCVK